MKLLMAAAIFGISFGNYGCSNEAKFAGRPMAAAGAPAAPVASPGAAIQTGADANPSGVTTTGAAITTTTGTTTVATTGTPPAVSSRWVDVTTNAAGAASSCATDPGRCTFKQRSTSMKATANLGAMNWTTAKARCAGLTYNGAAGWSLPSKEQLQSMFTDLYEADVWSKANWSAGYWSASLYSDSNLAYYVSLLGGSAFDYTTTNRMTGVTLEDVMRGWNSNALNVLCVQ